MAYSFFPKTEQEIKDKLKTSDKNKVGEILLVFKFLKSKYDVETPINIDTAKLGTINISRSLQGDVDIPTVKRSAKTSYINMKFGDGSSGNRGANNRGNEFERKYAQAMRDWWAGEPVIDPLISKSIQQLESIYSLNKLKDLGITVEEVGGANQPRPLVFTPKIEISNKAGIVGNDIGKVVTDLTVSSAGKDIGYLSLKMSTTVTFFNAGVATILTAREIDSGNITNENGVALLKLFGINPIEFCKVFNGEMKRGYSVDMWSDMGTTAKQNLKHLLNSGIGYGYAVVHKLSGQIKTYYVDENYLEKASSPTSCVIYYKGKTGTGKRIDIEVKTGKYVLKINIRDKQGKAGYPSHIMCDFSYI